MIGSRQMDSVLAAAEAAGAKVVLVGDPEQLQAIEAGAAFRALAERHGAAEITEVRRQREGWQRDATRELATGRTEAALERYEVAGMVQGHRTHEEARRAVVEGWGARRDAAQVEGREESAIILAHTRADVDHGYAATIRKAQGVTVDRAHVLASSGLDRHAAYVALTRHRDGVALHYGADQFRDSRELAKTLGRERGKDTTLDYPATFAERRGISVPENLQRAAKRAPERQEGGFEQAIRELAGVAPSPRAQAPAYDERRQFEAMMSGVRGYAAARAEVERTIRQGLPVPDRQQEAMTAARGALTQLSPEAAADLRSALSRNPGMAERAATPAGTGEVMRAMEQEAEVRRSPELRAARFVEDWRTLDTQREGLFRFSDRPARQAVEARMGRLAHQLKGDPEL